MPSAKSLINRISAAIKKVGPMARTSYKRVTVVTGGDELIGRGGSSQNFDTKFTPQPIFRQLGHRQAMYLSTATVQLVADDYKFTFPVTQVTEADFQDPRVTLVLVDGNGEEVFRVLYINTDQYAGKDVVMSVFVRSIGHNAVPLLNIATPSGSPNQTVQQYVDQQIAAEDAAENWGSF